jgi:hypothetical protein
VNKWFFALMMSVAAVFAIPCQRKEAPPIVYKPQGWSFDVGGSYSYMWFPSSPTYSGSTGGALAKVTYQVPDDFFWQARSYYNIGPLSSSVNKSNFQESYSELLAGYCVTAVKNWTITPYLGVGIDFLFDDHTGYDSIAPIHLNYTIYYAVGGLETHYVWPNWMLGLRLDCFPTFNQYLRVKSLSGAAWTLKNKVGAEVQVPFAYRYAKNFWFEVSPYFRFFPIGSSSALSLPERNLKQTGVFVTFRFFL